MLYETIESLRKAGFIKNVPSYIPENLNHIFKLRPYQERAFQNFITYYENENLRQLPTQTLFHMATGSGKTLIMAGLMLYLYMQGYRNFLFFVNLDNIVQKTKENFLNGKSLKYLFDEEINLLGEHIKVKEVENFQYSDSNAINICFTTIQGLHSDIWFVKENAMSIEDFIDKEVVLISDEAHHINADTKRGSKEEQELYHSWEHTVSHIFGANNKNVLLEFTATCDLSNANIKAAYENKIIFDYPLKSFREDKYSKEIKTLRSDVSIMERALQAIVLSQYRLKVFQDNRLSIKPVVLFKAAKIADSIEFMKQFIEEVKRLRGDTLERLAGLTTNDTLKEVFSYFETNGITYDRLAQELKEEFNEYRCISVNDKSEAEDTQIIINTLEDPANPFRAVFEVKKLDEGWDVLNLFDIVRLYETRQSGRKKLSPATISEAQLIGRGARYCPFKISDEQSKFQRKYDDDLDNALRICEELYYHCQNDSRYIAELTQALKETGIIADTTVERVYRLKEDFKADELYEKGYVFKNKRLTISRNDINELLPSIRDKEYTVTFHTGKTGEDTVLSDTDIDLTTDIATYTKRYTIKEIANINYAIVHKALRQYEIFKFNTLKSYFPNLSSTRQFILDEKYLGKISVAVTSKYNCPTPAILYEACLNVLRRIANALSGIEEMYEGSKEFYSYHIHDIFKNKRVNFDNPHDGGKGISQNDISVAQEYKIDLSNEDWFVFDDNYGTTEEKAFVAYFKGYVDTLKEKYDKVYLIRNERHLAIYSFNGGERFEPDYLLFLHKNEVDGYEQMQIFIEPKGEHLIKGESWKEEFLLQLESNFVPIVKFADDNKYKIWGFHFFNRQLRSAEFNEDMRKI